MNGRPICPSLPSIQVLLLSSFAADILLLRALSFPSCAPPPLLPPQAPIILPFRPFSLFSSLNSFPLRLPFRHDSPRPLPLLLVSSLFRSGFTLWPGPLFDPRREHEKKTRDCERALPACYVDERNKTAMESRARLFWFRGACPFAPPYFIVNLSAPLFTSALTSFPARSRDYIYKRVRS